MKQRKKWLDAAESFRIDIHSIVKCPNCEKENLTVLDIAFNTNAINMGGERCIECPECRKFEIVLYRNPHENWCIKK
ncbi:hypothetical protein NJT12_24350 [Flavobacterium sp. AC]|uniref:Uncharacterized protein n=1 Tax=Flavobacterium azizsancarii TaxID=2961580 RepID=A0ABT4WLL8_9FLAO|nr:hypothetical protein [Flavobacterium azizsancarii]MDA6072759.1 hypothetical protein [Flavobacterium azizsancarii]